MPEGVALGVELGVALGVAEGVALEVGVPEGVAVTVGLGVPVAVDEAVGLASGVGGYRVKFTAVVAHTGRGPMGARPAGYGSQLYPAGTPTPVSHTS